MSVTADPHAADPGSGVPDGTIDSPTDPPDAGATGRRDLRDRPVLATFVVGVAAAAYHLWWIAEHRGRGGFGVDESGALARSITLQQAWSSGPGHLVSEFLHGPREAPLLPLLSVPFVGAFGRSTTAALAVQPLIYLVMAVAVAALAARLTSPRAALVAGLVALGLPVAILQARYANFALLTSTCLVLAMLALVASERGARRSMMVWFGVAVGALVLSRTMAVAFVPGLAVGAWVLLERTRRVLANLALAAFSCLAVGGPWWWTHLTSSGAYLVSFGYGGGATQIEAVPLPARVPIRLGLTMTDVRPLLLVPTAILVVSALRARRRRHRGDADRAPWSERRRALVACFAVAGVSFLALVSTSNFGSWFQMPIEVLLIAPVAAVAAQARPSLRRVLVPVIVTVAAANLILTSWWTIGGSTVVGGGSLSGAIFGGTEVTQQLDFAKVDPRFSAGASASRRADAEREWARAAERIAGAVQRVEVADRPVLQSQLGANRLLSSTVLQLTEVLDGRRHVDVDQPARPEDMSTADYFTPTSKGRQRILIVVRSPYYLTTERSDDPNWIRNAQARGWRIRRSVPLPDGGRAVILTHPDSDGTAP